jgi:hypothetical protein
MKLGTILRRDLDDAETGPLLSGWAAPEMKAHAIGANALLWLAAAARNPEWAAAILSEWGPDLDRDQAADELVRDVGMRPRAIRMLP